MKAIRGTIGSLLESLDSRYKVGKANLFSGPPTGLGTNRRILYIDKFSRGTSNFYWLKAFQIFGQVKALDITRVNRRSLERSILDFKPCHIHLGGSVKTNVVPLWMLADIRGRLGCSISAFYGDAKDSLYHRSLTEVVDHVYVSNKSYGDKSKFSYMPCPTDPNIFNYSRQTKKYDLVFIGNNNQASRLALLKELDRKFGLKVFGRDWSRTGLNWSRSVYGKSFAKACNKAKICLGIVAPEYVDLEAYFSNRLVNTLATRSFFICTYTPGLESVLTNFEHLVWYYSEEELFRLIEHYLEYPDLREVVALRGQKEVYSRYTYKESVRRILLDAGVVKTTKYNLNLDDPLPCCTDFGLLRKLVQLFPKIKVTLFLPISNRMYRESQNNILEHLDWCRKIAQLPSENFEVALHGYYHQLEDKAKTPEFKYLSREEAKDLILRCEEALRLAGIPFTRGFRPPRWDISEGTRQALDELDYLYLSDTVRLHQYHSTIGIPRVFSNSEIDVNRDHPMLKSHEAYLLDPSVYYIHRGHLVPGMTNSLTKTNFRNIVRTINSFESVDFKFLSEIATELKREVL